MARGLNLFLALGALPLLCGWSHAAVAQLADPTRPAILNQSTEGKAEATSAGNGLQTVILKKDGKGRSVAVIDGQLVRLGCRLGDAKLVKVEEDRVSLKNSEGTEILRLTPSVEKKISRNGVNVAEERETCK